MDKYNFFCNKYGFVADNDKTKIKNIFNNNKFNNLHIEIYSNSPYMLLLRAVESNVLTEVKDGRIIAGTKSNEGITTVLNILLENIDRCFIKQYDDTRYEIVFSLLGLQYKMFIW